MHDRPRHRFPVLLRQVQLLLTTACLAAVAYPSHAQPADATELLVDVTPFTSSTATLVSIRADGTASAIDYSPARLQVARVRRGVLSGGETSPIFRAVQNQGLRSALGRNFGGTGLSQGDQFRLTVVQTPDSPPASGFVDDAPPAVRALIANALALGLQLQRTPVAYGYVRASNVPPLRAADLLSTSQLKQLRVEDAPGGLRPSLERVRQQPGRFVPVTSDEYTRWAAAGARGLLVIDGQSVLEVQLFSTEEK